MNLPGLTAEASLHQTSEKYNMTKKLHSSEGFVQLAFRQSCYSKLHRKL